MNRTSEDHSLIREGVTSISTSTQPQARGAPGDMVEKRGKAESKAVLCSSACVHRSNNSHSVCTYLLPPSQLHMAHTVATQAPGQSWEVALLSVISSPSQIAPNSTCLYSSPPSSKGYHSDPSEGSHPLLPSLLCLNLVAYVALAPLPSGSLPHASSLSHTLP